MATARYEVSYSHLSEAWRIWDNRLTAWCRLGRPPELEKRDLAAYCSRGVSAEWDAAELCWDEKAAADAWLIHCYREWGQIPTIREPHPGDKALGFAAV